MKPSRKKWMLMLIVLAVVNLVVILSFVFLTKRIRTDEKLRLNSIETPNSERESVI